VQGGGGGEGQGQGGEAAAAAAVRVHDQERGRPPRGRLPVAQVRPEGRQEQPIPQVCMQCTHCSCTYACTLARCFIYRLHLLSCTRTMGRHGRRLMEVCVQRVRAGATTGARRRSAR
jgi:hypothetical protein